MTVTNYSPYVNLLHPPAGKDTKQELKELKKAPCLICLDPLEEKECAILDCGHVLHTECEDEWFANRDALECPSCKKIVEIASRIPLFIKPHAEIIDLTQDDVVANDDEVVDVTEQMRTPPKKKEIIDLTK